MSRADLRRDQTSSRGMAPATLLAVNGCRSASPMLLSMPVSFRKSNTIRGDGRNGSAGAPLNSNGLATTSTAVRAALMYSLIKICKLYKGSAK